MSERCKGKSEIEEAFRGYALMGAAPRIAGMDLDQATKEHDAKGWAEIAIGLAGVVNRLVEVAAWKARADTVEDDVPELFAQGFIAGVAQASPFEDMGKHMAEARIRIGWNRQRLIDGEGGHERQ